MKKNRLYILLSIVVFILLAIWTVYCVKKYCDVFNRNIDKYYEMTERCQNGNVSVSEETCTYLKSQENPEHIICKCLLKDCIYMDEDFINEVKKNKEEYNSGHYEVGRFAWQLEVIEVLEEPIYAKGQLGIWNF